MRTERTIISPLSTFRLLIDRVMISQAHFLHSTADDTHIIAPSRR